MRLFITAITTVLLGTASFADNSSRYNDLRLDTSETLNRVYSGDSHSTDLDQAQRGRDQYRSTADELKSPDATFSSRSDAKSRGEGYLYGGWGNGNDSR